MNQFQVKRKRAVSAKYQRKRPVSAVVKEVDRAEFVQKVYANELLTKKSKCFYIYQNPKLTPQEMMSLCSSKQLHKQHRKIQHLIQENIYLKKKNQKLQQQRNLLVTQLQGQKRKNLKFTKNLNIQFQNQVLWSGTNNYLITGIKNQYENLKKRFQDKQQECDFLKKQNYHTKMIQYEKYCYVLEKQNIKLVQKLNNIQLKNKTVIPQNSNTQKMHLYMIDQMKAQIKKLQAQMLQQQVNLFNKINQIEDNQKKIKLLEKRFIEKDNNYHAQHRKNIKMEKNIEKMTKQIQQMTKQIQQLRQKIKIKQKQHKEYIKKTAQSQARKSEAQRQLFRTTLAQQSPKIQKIQNQVAQLTTLLSQWKPLDQNNNKNEEKQSNQDKNISLVLSKPINIVEQNKKKEKNAQSLVQNALRRGLQFSKVNQKTNIKKPRVQKTADKKNSQFSQKVRKVDINEVQQIGQILKYRCIGQRISLQNVKKFFQFSFKLQKQENVDQKQTEQKLQWEQTYITMKEVKEILMNNTFKLTQDQAKLLSRYLIEDATGEYVYCDEENQNKRNIVKSIIGTILGDFQYSLQKSKDQIQKITKIELQKYGERIKTILQQMYKTGIVSKKKLFQIFVGSGMQIPLDIKQYIIGKLILESQNLQSLQYKKLF